LPFGTLVIKTIQAHVFHQDIQTVNKRPSGRRPVITLGCGGSINTRLLRLQG